MKGLKITCMREEVFKSSQYKSEREEVDGEELRSKYINMYLFICEMTIYLAARCEKRKCFALEKKEQ